MASWGHRALPRASTAVMGLVSSCRLMSRGTDRGLSSIIPFIFLQRKPELACPLCHPLVG